MTILPPFYRWILLLLLSFPLPVRAGTGLFVDFRELDAASFFRLLQTKSSNIQVHLEYNPLIPLSLSWNGAGPLEGWSAFHSNNGFGFFLYGKKSVSGRLPYGWFMDERIRQAQKAFSGMAFSASNAAVLEAPAGSMRIQNLAELTNILSSLSRAGGASRPFFTLGRDLCSSAGLESVVRHLARGGGLRWDIYVSVEANPGLCAIDAPAWIDHLHSIRTKQELSESGEKLFDLAFFIYHSGLFSQGNEALLNLFPYLFGRPCKGAACREYTLAGVKYATIHDQDHFITFDTRTGLLKRWFIHSRGECLVPADSFREKIFLSVRGGVIPLEKKEIRYSSFDNGLSFSYDLNEGLRVEKNVILQNGRILLSYKVQNREAGRKAVIFQLENTYSPSLHNALTAPPGHYSFYCIYGKKLSGQWTPDFTNFVNQETRLGVAWENYNAVAGFEFLRMPFSFLARSTYRFTLLPHEQKVITVAYRRVVVPEKVRDRFLGRADVRTNQVFGDYKVR